MKRESIWALRERHWAFVERLARRPSYNRLTQFEFMLPNYEKYFGPIRWPRSAAAPNDQLRKALLLAKLLDQVDARRLEIEEDSARRASK